MRNRGKRAGFTLVEAVVASALMVVAFTAAFGMISFARRSSALTENRLAALHIARQVMESLVSQSYSSTSVAVGTTQLAGNRGYYVVTEDSDGKTKNIAVTIRWTEGQEVKSITITTSHSKSLHK